MEILRPILGCRNGPITRSMFYLTEGTNFPRFLYNNNPDLSFNVENIALA